MQDITVKPAQKLLLSCSFGHAALPPRIPKQFLSLDHLWNWPISCL